MAVTNVKELKRHLWHHLSIDDVTRQLSADFEKGLSSEEVVERHNRFGPNQLTAQSLVTGGSSFVTTN